MRAFTFVLKDRSRHLEGPYRHFEYSFMASNPKEAWRAFGDMMADNLTFIEPKRRRVTNAAGLRYARKHYKLRPKRKFDHHEREGGMFP